MSHLAASVELAQVLLAASAYPAQLLLAANADVQATEEGGWTPLFFASREGHADMAQVLLDARTDVQATEEMIGRCSSAPARQALLM